MKWLANIQVSDQDSCLKEDARVQKLRNSKQKYQAEVFSKYSAWEQQKGVPVTSSSLLNCKEGKSK